MENRFLHSQDYVAIVGSVVMNINTSGSDGAADRGGQWMMSGPDRLCWKHKKGNILIHCLIYLSPRDPYSGLFFYPVFYFLFVCFKFKPAQIFQFFWLKYQLEKLLSEGLNPWLPFPEYSSPGSHFLLKWSSSPPQSPNVAHRVSSVLWNRFNIAVWLGLTTIPLRQIGKFCKYLSQIVLISIYLQ